MSVPARRYSTTGDPLAGAPEGGFVPEEVGAARGRAFPAAIVLLAVVTVLVGAWGALAPYVGPDFGFVADRASAWQWTETSAVLALAPGAIAVICGLLVLQATSRVSNGRRPDLGLLGLFVAACGAWFTVGQYVWPVVDAKRFITPAGANHYMWKELCFAVGPGVVLVVCGAVFMGWAVRRQVVPVADRYPRVVAPVAPRSTSAERPVASETGRPIGAETGRHAWPATTGSGRPVGTETTAAEGRPPVPPV